RFDGFTRWVVNEDLLAANAGHDLVAKVRSRLAQCLDRGGEIVDFNREAVPASELGPGSIGHRLATAARRIGRAEYETQVTSGEHGKSRSRMHLFVEAQMLAIERHGGVDIVDNVANLNAGH